MHGYGVVVSRSSLNDSSSLLTGQSNGEAFREDELVEFIRNFMIAGRDTTAITLSFCVYELSRNPDIEARVLKEMNDVIGAGPVTAANLAALEYTKQVIMETLRMYPPGDCPCERCLL